MFTNGKVKADGLHVGPLCLFFSWRMKVLCAQHEPTFSFVLLKHVANLLLNYGQVFRVAPLGICLSFLLYRVIFHFLFHPLRLLRCKMLPSIFVLLLMCKILPFIVYDHFSLKVVPLEFFFLLLQRCWLTNLSLKTSHYFTNRKSNIYDLIYDCKTNH
jgi:hypothetical protein